MSDVYFTGCKLKAGAPELAAATMQFVDAHYDMRQVGCCRIDAKTLDAEDRAVFICNTCGIFLDEMIPETKRVSIWEVMAADEQLQLPDYRGEEMALQDCWRAKENPAIHEAVRLLLKRMNIKVIELDESREDCDFCGITLMAPLLPYYEEFAPRRFGTEKPAGLFSEHSDAERQEAMLEHAQSIPTQKVACYCLGCADGLARGGKTPVYLMQLILSAPH